MHSLYTASPHASHSACTDVLARAVCCERTYAILFGSTHGSHSACKHRHVSALKLLGARICPCARQSRFTHRHQVLGRHICAARKRLHKQGLKTIGTKTCFAHIHTYPPARKDSAGETISAVRLGLVTQLLLRGHTWVSRRSHGNIVCIYNISVSTYCCFAVALSVPRAALPRHIFTATKRLQKQGLKTIGHIYTASPHGSHSACTDMLCVG